MLEKPPLNETDIAACLHDTYGLAARTIEFLPIGYDSYAAVYRVATEDGRTYFLKVKKDAVKEVSLTLPRYLRAHGMPQVVAPLPTLTDVLWGTVDGYSLIVYPFIDGQAGMDVGLTDAQWIEYGASLRQLHAAQLPPDLAVQVPREEFVPNPHWAQIVRRLHVVIPTQNYDDPYAQELAAFWRERHEQIGQIVQRAEALGRMLQNKFLNFVLCHADIHTANLLIDKAGALFIVDWDQPVFAPKERDLMFIVGGTIGEAVTSRQEALFFQGYGASAIDPLALAYYRYEWAVQDMGGFAEPVFLSKDAGEVTKEDSVRHFKRLFAPGDIVDAAVRSDVDLQ